MINSPKSSVIAFTHFDLFLKPVWHLIATVAPLKHIENIKTQTCRSKLFVGLAHFFIKGIFDFFFKIIFFLKSGHFRVLHLHMLKNGLGHNDICREYLKQGCYREESR